MGGVSTCFGAAWLAIVSISRTLEICCWNIAFVDVCAKWTTIMELPLVVLFIIFYVLLLSVGFLLNAIFLKVILSSRTERRKISNLYLVVFLIVSMTACLFITSYHLICLIAQLPQGKPFFSAYPKACKGTIFFVYSSSVLRVTSLVLLCFDRFWALRWPFHYVKYSKKKTLLLLVCFVTIQSILTILPVTFMPGWVVYQDVIGASCIFRWSSAPIFYIIPVILLDFVLPALILLVTNVFVFVLARRHQMKIEEVRKWQRSEGSSKGLGLTKTLIKAVELMEVERTTDSPLSGTSVSSNVTKDCICNPMAVDDMEEKCQSKLDSGRKKEPSEEGFMDHQSEQKVFEIGIINATENSDVERSQVVNGAMKIFDSRERNGDSSQGSEGPVMEEKRSENKNFGVNVIEKHLRNKQETKIQTKATGSVLNDSDHVEFANLTKEKQLRVLSLPNGRFSTQHLEVKDMKWNSAISTLLLVLLFLVTWLPFIVSRLVEKFSSTALSVETIGITAALNNCDVVINPLIILFTRGNLRRKFKSCFKSLFLVCKRIRSSWWYTIEVLWGTILDLFTHHMRALPLLWNNGDFIRRMSDSLKQRLLYVVFEVPCRALKCALLPQN